MATEFKLVASDTNEFGRAVALSGDYAIVGAREKSGFPGSAYVFVKNGTGWAKQAKLSGSVKQETDDFGFAVAIEGDYAIVGARYTVGPQYGRAYVFHRNGSDWVEESVLVPIDPMAPWNYLRSIALSGDWALVGTDAALHFFQRIGSTWTEQPQFMSLYPVSLSGNYLVTRNSLAYVFQRNGTTWQQRAVLTANDDFDGGVGLHQWKLHHRRGSPRHYLYRAGCCEGRGLRLRA
jgi:FG-GAP repeat